MDRVYGVMLIGCGHIGEEHIADIYYRDNIRIEAVVDQQPERAALFARKYGARHCGTDYRPFLESAAVDIVIIATYADTHLPILQDCLAAGKHVLCEKPIADTPENGRRFYELAKSAHSKVLVAHILRHNRSYQKLAELIASGVIGEVQAIDANLCYPTTAKARITDPALAGGALLDVGVYPINFIDMIMHNAPIARVESSMQPYETGVDAHNSMTFYYQNGVMATAQSSILCHSDRMGAVWGTEGYLTCQNINNVEAIDVFDGSHAVTAHYDVPEQLTGYEYEVASAAQAMLDGRTECDEMPHSDTLRIMELMDSLRADWGLKYPFEA